MVAMEKLLFNILLLVAFLLSFESLVSGPKEIKLSDEFMWLFNEGNVLAKMNSHGTLKLLENLNHQHYSEMISRADKAENERLAIVLMKATELQKAQEHLEEVERNYQQESPKLIEQTKEFVVRSKKDLLRELRDYHADDKSLAKLFE